jgi:hypothetical protein
VRAASFLQDVTFLLIVTSFFCFYTLNATVNHFWEDHKMSFYTNFYIKINIKTLDTWLNTDFRFHSFILCTGNQPNGQAACLWLGSSLNKKLAEGWE